MPRNISFALTTDQIKNRTKTVTRRVNWWKDKNGRQIVKVGDVLNACVKCMGLKPGEQIERICEVRIVNIRREPLERMETLPAYGRLRCKTDPDNVIDDDYGNAESAKEGFPNMTGSEFVRMFCENMNVHSSDDVTRIEFEYI